MAKLTEKQKMFCKYYIVDLNATDAARKAGYSKKTANRIASENLTKLVIHNEIQRLLKKRSEKLEIKAEDVLLDILDTRSTCKNNMLKTDNMGNDIIDGAAVTGRNKANELLGKHLKLFTEKMEHSGTIEHKYADLSDDELEEKIKKHKK